MLSLNDFKEVEINQCLSITGGVGGKSEVPNGGATCSTGQGSVTYGADSTFPHTQTYDSDTTVYDKDGKATETDDYKKGK